MKSRQWLAMAVTGLMLLCLQTAMSGASGGGSACQLGDYELETTQLPWTLDKKQHRGGVLLTLGITTERMIPCHLHRKIMVRIRYRVGGKAGNVVRRIRGNPFRWYVNRRFKPWGMAVHTWVWRNWCGRRTRFVITVSGRRHLNRISVLPKCHDKRRASKVIFLGAGTAFLPRTGSRIPAQMLTKKAPPHYPPPVLKMTNGWEVSDGRTLVAAYTDQQEMIQQPGGLPSIARTGSSASTVTTLSTYQKRAR